MTLRDVIPDTAKVWIRAALARLGIEIGTYTGSFAEHRILLLARGEIETVWDVGAHIGQYATRLRSHGYVGQIVSIEPGHEAFSRLVDRTKNDERWTAVAVAISDFAGRGNLNVSANGQSSSLLLMDERHRLANPNSRYVDRQSVEITTLDLLQSQLAPVVPFYLKLDLQGGELAALRGASSVLRSTFACEVELSFTQLYQGGASWQEAAAYLAAADFVICDIERVFFDPVSRDLLQVNALFRRRT